MSTSTFPPETIKDILASTVDADWTNAGSKPDRIDFLWEYTHDERTSYPNPSVYIWSPTDGTISKFSIDADNMDETETVECFVQTLEGTLTKQIQRDVISILSGYYDDNEANTNFHRIEPQNKSDLRNEHIASQTDYFIATVQAELRAFTDTA